MRNEEMAAILADVLTQEAANDGDRLATIEDDVSALLAGMDPAKIEAAARHICAVNGGDPDAPITVGRPRPSGDIAVNIAWQAYAVLAAQVAQVLK